MIHPEKYLLKPDVPTDLDLGTVDAGSDWKEVTRNVVGEMQMAVLLKAHGGKEAAAGWDGDSVPHVRRSQGQARAGLGVDLGQRGRRSAVRRQLPQVSDQ